ncbi:DUF4229 domain-containing protein [Nakamurella flava]|uniref:DUF4229 domain-containing protein n=1 Tax=Nakamurella flava TaxID=2576308 RepID=A0A4U6QEB2_9ACTN|nr:DUF4229 domain-containing protein [Nakamurella flava]TKV58577.1 DUF4229 domain-containing protein [Nakamurella flava]
MTSPSSPDPAATPGPGTPAADRQPPLAMSLLAYTGLRLLLVAVLTAVLMIFMPLIVALLFAFVLQLPLAWVLFGRWRRQVNDAMARATATRRSERARLQGALTGEGAFETPSDEADTARRDAPPPRS